MLRKRLKLLIMLHNKVFDFITSMVFNFRKMSVTPKYVSKIFPNADVSLI